jgi:hypothetical protein
MEIWGARHLDDEVLAPLKTAALAIRPPSVGGSWPADGWEYEVSGADLVDDWNGRQERDLPVDLCEDEVAAKIGDMVYSEGEGTPSV